MYDLAPSSEIYLKPRGVDFRTEPFLWRLSSALVTASCAWSVFPHYQNHIVLLPKVTASISAVDGNAGTSPDGRTLVSDSTDGRVVTTSANGGPSVATPATVMGTATITPVATAHDSAEDVRRGSLVSTSSTTAPTTPSSSKPTLRIRHNGEAKVHVVKPLIPYTYDAAWTTTCEITQPCQDLTLIVNKSKIKVDVTVETVDSDTTFQKLLLAPTTILCRVGVTAVWFMSLRNHAFFTFSPFFTTTHVSLMNRRREWFSRRGN